MKGPSLTPHINLSQKLISMAEQTCETCVGALSFTWGQPAECGGTEEDVKTVLSCRQSRSVRVNISVPVKLLAKSFASPWGIFSEASNKQHSSSSSQTTAEQRRHFKDMQERDLKLRDAPRHRDSLQSWQQSGGLVWHNVTTTEAAGTEILWIRAEAPIQG